MPLKRRLGYALYGIGLALVLAFFFLAETPLRGWVVLVGLSLLALTAAAGMMQVPWRRYSIAFGVTLFVGALNTGRSDIWPDAPYWVSRGGVVASLCATAWFVLEALRVQQQATRGAPRRKSRK